MDRSQVTAFLGPTNTGKTHRAIVAMLAHETGAMALPLRLLAREVYDRVAKQVGEESVALVTGEERRVPKAPRYWISTTEAMDTERVVDFVAVDEVQLMEDRERGHVFTDRVMYARGRKETCFLGSASARNVLLSLVPHAVLSPAPRLSRLTHAGSATLKKLPARSAVVAFSMAEVVELAERAKARGGAAVVMGALSPRARNAQVAMFQAGEVDMLVATDAIGMGLNLDVRHVAFAKLRKFDGQSVRDVEISEVSQIAGRAGRYVTDGTFGGLSPLVFPHHLVHAVEHHAVPAIRRVRYRARPSFESLEELVASLHVRAKAAPWLLPAADVDDTRALDMLSKNPEARSRATSPERVRLLWDVCSIPDFRKLLFESHVAFLTELYVELCDRGPVSDDFLGARFAGLSDTVGDVDTLLARIAHVRLLSYVAQKASFVRRPDEVRALATEWEDRLSDALHLALVARFVDSGTRRTTLGPAPRGRPRAAPSGTLDETSQSSRSLESQGPFAALAGLRAKLGPAKTETLVEASIVEAVVSATFDDFALLPDGAITLGGVAIARLVRGKRHATPGFRVTLDDDLRGGERLRVERRIGAYVMDLSGYFVRQLRPLPPTASPPLRGLLFRLEEGLGGFFEHDARAELGALSDTDRSFLAERGVVARGAARFSDVTARGRTLRAALVYVGTGERGPEGDPETVPARAFPRGVSPLLFGYWKSHGVWIRGDLEALPDTSKTTSDEGPRDD